ncbi:inositol polyphosphate kinase family protein [Streptomyces sp. NPDC059271]|uniref:inositol polyphosphate kinase family protein n=1 Tax=Streptomyces sp. NPDC059271 TaxID=3346799 RepID=UPI0036D19E7A
MATPVDTTNEISYASDDEAERSALREGRRSTSPSPERNVNQGGHGGITPLGPNAEILQKGAPQGSVENEFYERVRADAYPHFTPVVPASYTADEVRTRLGDSLSSAQLDGLDDRQHIYIENITSGLADSKTLDTKIGKSTTSYRENLEQHDKGKWAAGTKALKFAIGVDPATGSSFRGWRAVGGTDAGESRLITGMQSQKILSKFSEDPAVWDQLITKMQDIRTAAQNSDIGFIASSVFSVTGTKEGQAVVDAKLIDFAHVIDAAQPFKQSPSVSPDGSPRLGPAQLEPGARPANRTDLTNLKNKYREQFIAGMDALIGDATRVRGEKGRAQMAQFASLNPAPGVAQQSTSTASQGKPYVPPKNTQGAAHGR